MQLPLITENGRGGGDGGGGKKEVELHYSFDAVVVVDSRETRLRGVIIRSHENNNELA